MAPKRVAVMQPYFFPYAGYFRLFAVVDEFVIFDCVQFPRRGRVHRTEVPRSGTGREWLTLPLARQPRDVLIRELEFASGARAALDRRLAGLKWVETSAGPAASRLRAYLHGALGSPIDFLEEGLRLVADLLGLAPRLSRSSVLALDPALRGQDRVIAAASAVGATHYVNAPGGRELYDPAEFARAGIDLSFLCPYEGRFPHLLPALMGSDPQEIRADVLETTSLLAP
jgi:WbqC-like protein family